MKRHDIAALGEAETPHAEQDSGAGSRLPITVVFTTTEGSLAALRSAGDFARNLGIRVVLVAVEVVPFALPLAQPAAPVSFLAEQLQALVSEAGAGSDEVRIEICLCRDREQCFEQILRPHSLVILAGRGGRWSGERKLEQVLIRLGHSVVFLNVASKARGTRQRGEGKSRGLLCKI